MLFFASLFCGRAAKKFLYAHKYLRHSRNKKMCASIHFDTTLFCLIYFSNNLVVIMNGQFNAFWMSKIFIKKNENDIFVISTSLNLINNQLTNE